MVFYRILLERAERKAMPGKVVNATKRLYLHVKIWKSANCIYVQFFCWEYKLNFASDSIVITTPLAIIECLCSRWHNHLKPGISAASWTKQEEWVVVEAHSTLGNKWAKIAKLLQAK